jgi:hypothetical protein
MGIPAADRPVSFGPVERAMLQQRSFVRLDHDDCAEEDFPFGLLGIAMKKVA